MSKTRIYRIGGRSVEVPSDMSADEVRKVWAEVFPGLEHANIQENQDGSVEFTTKGGVKG